MHCQNYLDALDTVFAMDLPDEAFVDAINDQFRLMTGVDAEDACIRTDAWERYPDNLRYLHS